MNVSLERLHEVAVTRHLTLPALAEYAGTTVHEMLRICVEHRIPYKLKQGATLTDEIRVRLVEMHAAGALYREMTAETGVNVKTLSAFFCGLGLKRKSPRGIGSSLDPALREQMFQMFAEGRSTREIAAVTGFSQQYVRRVELMLAPVPDHDLPPAPPPAPEAHEEPGPMYSRSELVSRRWAHLFNLWDRHVGGENSHA
jgi:uncharacterized protein YerC